MKPFDDGDITDAQNDLAWIASHLDEIGVLPGSNKRDLAEIGDLCCQISLLVRLAKDREAQHIRNAFNCGRLRTRTLGETW